jgi:hypothetical protein
VAADQTETTGKRAYADLSGKESSRVEQERVQRDPDQARDTFGDFPLEVLVVCALVDPSDMLHLRQ